MNSSGQKSYLAMSIVSLLVLPGLLGLMQVPNASAGSAVVTIFDGGLTQKEMDFEFEQSNTSLGFAIPKESVVGSASMDVEAKIVSRPGQIFLDTKEDFLGAKPRNMNLNRTMGNAYLFGDENGTDQFNDGVLDSNWTWYNSPESYYENQTSGMLEIVSPNGVTWWNNTLTAPYLHRPITGDFLMTSKMSATVDENIERAGMMVYKDDGNWFMIVARYFRQGNNGGPTVSLYWRSNNGGSQFNSRPYSANPMYFKITRDVNVYTLYYSNNPDVWTEYRDFTFNWGDTVQVGMIVGDGNANSNFTAEFDYFRVSQYVDKGGFLVGPITTPLPTKKVNLDQDLEQLETWEEFKVEVRADPAAPWEHIIAGAQQTLSVAGTQLEMRVNVSGMGWTSPTIRSITLDYVPESWPSNITVDVGNDGSVEWFFEGTFNKKATVSTPEFSQAMEDLKNNLTAGADEYVHFPMKVTSETAGKLLFNNLEINLFTGTPAEVPTIVSPDDNIWIDTLLPTFVFSSEDADSDSIQYRLEISEDNFATYTYYFDMLAETWGWSEPLYYSGQQASFTMYSERPLMHGKTYKWRVKAFDGAWWSDYTEARILKVDVTLPTGTITDGGAATPVTKDIRATITAVDEESGVEAVECGLGTARNSTDVVPMTPVNMTTMKVHYKNLSLIDDKTYYFTARAKNVAGSWSLYFNSDGIKVDLDLDHPPTVEVLNPANHSVVDGVLTISGTAADPDPADTISVLVAIDDGPFDLAFGSTMWSFEWDTTKVKDGEHNIYVKASDTMRDSVTKLLIVVVGNGRLGFRISDFTPNYDPTLNETETQEFTVTIRDPGNIFRSYTWDVDGLDISNSNAANFTYAPDYASAGKHTVTVKALGVGVTITHTWNVTVNNINRDPTALIVAPKAKDTLVMGEKVEFDGTGSTDPDPETLKYSWDFGDGKSGTGSTTTHKYSKAGEFKVKLTVTDPYNASDTYSIKVTVEDNTGIVGQFTTMPMCLIPLVLLIVIILVVVLLIVRSRKKAHKFEAQLVDDDLTSPIPEYDPTPKGEGSAAAKITAAKESDAKSEFFTSPPPTAAGGETTGEGGEEQPAPAAAPAPSEPMPEMSEEDYSVVDTEASKQGPVWGAAKPDGDEDEDEDKPTGPAWTQKKEDDGGEDSEDKPVAASGPAWAQKKEEDDD